MLHDRSFDPAYGQLVAVADGIRRLTANNPGPFTFHGTNTYVVGWDRLAVIDPGPADPGHIDRLVKSIGKAKIDAILVSHTHMDHSPGARLLQLVTGAPIVGCAPHRPARELALGEINPMDASSDADHVPDTELTHLTTAKMGDASFQVLATPGHTANHLCFALGGTDHLFSADHVMAWSTSIVAPPDGDMRAYMASLEVLLQRQEETYLPGHGGPVRDAPAYVAALKQHRMAREAAILNRLSAEPITIPEIVLRVYEGLDPALRPAAALSVYAHLEDICGRGLAQAIPKPDLDAHYVTSRTAGT